MRLKNTVTKHFIATVLIIFILQALMLVYVFGFFYKNSVDDIKALGISNMKSQASMVENYLNKGHNVLWFAAESVDYMLRNGENNEKILDYLMGASEQMQSQFDLNFTGIYGYLNGEYIDGAGWVPPDDYDPKSRSWYIEAVEGQGRMVLSEPYIDAQTGSVVVSYSQMLSDGESVISLDIVLNEVQVITEEMTMKDMGYGFVVNGEGLVIAHTEISDIGKNYLDSDEWSELLNRIYSESSDEFEIKVNGEACTVFTDKVVGAWYVVVVANNDLLYRQLRMKVMAGVLVSVAVFIVIFAFCFISVSKIRKAEEGEQESVERLREMNYSIIRSLASTIDAKDRYTSGHSQRVADYALMIAKRMGKSEEEQKIIYYAGLLHDVGKIRVPEEIINKPGKLTDGEFDSIRIHTVSGYHILNGIHDDERIGYGAKYHHERYDGAGYPNGISAENIPEVARIIAVADAYDAMTSDRSYRKAIPQDVVRSELVRGKGTQFDPEIADVMLQIIDEDRDYGLRQKEDQVSNILVVDDDKLVVQAVRHILKDMPGIRIFDAGSGQSALTLIDDIDISLILLDLKLPDTDGFELYQKIKEKHDVSVILLTGDKSIETINRLRELKIDDYVTKPLNEAITREAVHGILHRSEAEI
ncbi:MAG: response regulator [Lachnospiraceae bacterium]|nr:response regulator [Lachnospiraceae bacterium]